MAYNHYSTDQGLRLGVVSDSLVAKSNALIDMQTGGQPEPAVLNMVSDGNASELAHLRAEVQRLEADSKAEQDIIDDLFSKLTTAGEELEDVKTCLAAKESECADLCSKLDQQQGPAHPEPGRSTAAAIMALVGYSSVAVGAQQRQSNAMVDTNMGTNTNQVQELQELVQFFKGNSERLATEIWELRAQNQQLAEDVDVKNKELEDERMASLALKMQAGMV